MASLIWPFDLHEYSLILHQEIQEEIYKHALPGPRTVEFFPLKISTVRHKGFVDFHNNKYLQAQLKTSPSITTPALLHVNEHSRRWARKFYQPCFTDYLDKKSSVYIDFSFDTVIIPTNIELSYDLATNSRGPIYGKEYLKQIQNLAFFNGLHFEHTYEKRTIMSRLKTFNALKNVTYLKTGDENYNMRQIQELENSWTAESKKKKKKSGIVHEGLNIRMLSESDFAEEFGYDKLA